MAAGHLLGTFEYQPSLVGTQSPNREGVIGPSRVIEKLCLVEVDTPTTLAILPLVLHLVDTCLFVGLPRLTTTLSRLGNISRKSSKTTMKGQPQARSYLDEKHLEFSLVRRD